MTKWHDEKHKWEQNRDIPIGLPSNHDSVYDTRTYYCSNCRRPLIKLMNHVGDVSYYCDYGCASEINSAQAELELRSKSKLTISEGPIEEPAVTQLPEKTLPDRNKPVYHGGTKTLSERGTIKITSYSDSTKNKGWRITRLGKVNNENG